MYIGVGGEINYFTKKAFTRELDRRFRDGVGTVELNCDGDWADDPFTKSIPAANIGENRQWLTAS
jgi:hypothetical protein